MLRNLMIRFDAIQGIGYTLDGDAEQPRDENGRWTSVVSGSTYAHKESLKKAGYRWHEASKTWHKSLPTVSDTDAQRISEARGKEHPDRAFRVGHVGDVAFKDLKITLHKAYPANHTEARSGRAEKSLEVYRGAEFKEPRTQINLRDRDVMSEESVWGSRHG